MTSHLEQQIANLHFRRTADKSLRSSAAGQDLAGFQKAFSRHVARASKLCRKTTANFVALWSVDWQWASDSDALLAGRLMADDNVANVLTEFPATESCVGPFEALVISELLIRSSDKLSAQQTAVLVVRLAKFETDVHVWKQQETPSVRLPQQLVHLAEAPLVAGLVLSFLKSSKPLLKAGRNRIGAILVDAVDSDGSLHGNLVGSCHHFFASYVRISFWANCFKSAWISGKAQTLWQSSLSQATAACDKTGGVLDAAAASRQTSLPEILLLGCDLADFRLMGDSTRELLKAIGNVRGAAQADGKQPKTGSSTGSSQSDWAATATLRAGMSPRAGIASLAWSGDEVQIGVSCDGNRLLDGNWAYSIKVDGCQIKSMGQWVCTCWFQDDDAAFVELERGSSEGTRHVRQVMLSTTENIVLFVDSVTCPNPDSVIEFQSRLGHIFDEELSLQTNPITRELRGNSTMPQLRIIPAWLDDDRLLNSPGNCIADDGGIHLTASGTGGITVPLVIDWNAKRTHSEADWNRLTVTEDRKPHSQQESAGFRVRIGIYQLLIFRSLRPGTSLRAVLGYNTAHETVYGRVRNSGKIDPLVQVEAEV